MTGSEAASCYDAVGSACDCLPSTQVQSLHSKSRQAVVIPGGGTSEMFQPYTSGCKVSTATNTVQTLYHALLYPVLGLRLTMESWNGAEAQVLHRREHSARPWVW